MYKTYKLSDKQMSYCENGQLDECIYEAAKITNYILRESINCYNDLERKTGINVSKAVGSSNLGISDIFAASFRELSKELSPAIGEKSYPDLVRTNDEESLIKYNDYLRRGERTHDWPYGGVEVKQHHINIWKAGGKSLPRNQSINSLLRKNFKFIKPKSVAHHPYTNFIINVLWDYDLDGYPFIVAVFFANNLEPSDWTNNSKAKLGSRSTNCCSTNRFGTAKLASGLLLKTVLEPYNTLISKGVENCKKQMINVYKVEG